MPKVALVDSDVARRSQLALALVSVGGLDVNEFDSLDMALESCPEHGPDTMIIIEAYLATDLPKTNIPVPLLAYNCAPHAPNLPVPVVTLSMNAIPAFANDIVRFIAKTL